MYKEDIQSVVAIKIKQEDFVNKVFLKPCEFLLKTNNVDDNVALGDLPNGLKIAVKADFRQDVFDHKNIQALNPKHDFRTIKQNNTDNLISFLKSHDYSQDHALPTDEKNHLQLAICVCMYSEDKRLLKDTMRGIQDNVEKLILSGMNPDTIATFIFMDGIQKVDESVIQYFEELERQSGIYLGKNNSPSYTIADIERQLRYGKQDLNQTVQKNRNQFLFSTPQRQDRESRRFQSVRDQYFQFKQLKTTCQKLRAESKKYKNLYQAMPKLVQDEFFYKAALKHKLGASPNREMEIRRMPKDQLIQQYTDDASLNTLISIEALSKAIASIQKYFSTRSDLSYVASFRKKLHINYYPEGRDFSLTEQEDLLRHMNLFVCVKYRNAGKLSSHNWFFNGFCKELNPKYSILLDVGLKPAPDALYKMYYHLKNNPKVGGVCGFMKLKIEKIGDQQIEEDSIDALSALTLTFVDIQKTQQMQYNYAHIIDKAFQSAFGFIHVLPGAFSGYSMSALKPQQNQDKLLKQYFRSIGQKLSNFFIKKSSYTVMSVLVRILFPEFVYRWFYDIDPDSQQQMIYDENVCLAEDRILCMQIHKNGRDLVFLPDAFGQVDPIKTVHGLMGQRKRWMNGSLFAFDKVRRELSHMNSCQILLPLQIFFLNLQNYLAFFAIALFGFTFHISMLAFRKDVLPQIFKEIPKTQNNVNNTAARVFDFFVYFFDFVYAMIVGCIVFFSLTTPANRPVYKPYIYFVSTILGYMTLITFIVLLYDMIRGLSSETTFLTAQSFSDQIVGGKIILTIYRWSVVGLFGLFTLPLLLFCCLFCTCWPIVQTLKDTLSFIFYNTSYLILLTVYALARIDDISWGTKGLQSATQNQRQDQWKTVKLILFTKYIVWNIAASIVLFSFAQEQVPRFYITFAIMCIIIVTLMVRILIGSLYLIKYRLCTVCSKTSEVEPKHSDLGKVIQRLSQSIKQEIRARLIAISGFKNQGMSYIQAIRTYRNNKNAQEQQRQKFNQENMTRSKIFISKKVKIDQRASMRPQKAQTLIRR